MAPASKAAAWPTGPQASITLHHWRPLARLLLQGDLGLAASHRDGDWSTPDLTALLEFGIRNEASWGQVLEGSWLARRLGDLFRASRANTRRGSRRNIAFHYDMGNDFYAQWLDPDADLFERTLCDGRRVARSRAGGEARSHHRRCSICSRARRCSRSAAAGAPWPRRWPRPGARVTG